MSVWSTKSFDRERDYIVLQHTLKGVNYVINGVKFRDSYAVVEKDSKTYYFLKKVPVLRAAREYPLTHLSNLKFISRASDVKVVYGQDVYKSFLKQVAQEKDAIEAKAELERLEIEDKQLQQREQEILQKIEIEKQIKEALNSGDEDKAKELIATKPEIQKCCFRYDTGGLCKADAAEISPSGYCFNHLLEDSRLSEFGIEKPAFLTKDEKKKFREKVKSTLEEAKKHGKF